MKTRNYLSKNFLTNLKLIIMKTKRFKFALRASIVALALFGFASQGNEAEALCSIKNGDMIIKCSGDSGSCHFELGGFEAECSGSTVSTMMLKVMKD